MNQPEQLPKRDAKKEERLLRMLGSDNDHEALAALRKLQRRVGNWNVYVNELIKGNPGAQPAGYSHQQDARKYAWQGPFAYQGTWSDTGMGAAQRQYDEAMRRAAEETRKSAEKDAMDFLASLLRKGSSESARTAAQEEIDKARRARDAQYDFHQSQEERRKREEQERHEYSTMNKIRNGEIKVEQQTGESRESFARRKYAVEALMKRFGREA